MLEINVFRIFLSLSNIPVRPEEPSSLICLLITAFPILLKLSSDIPPTSVFFLAHVPFPLSAGAMSNHISTTHQGLLGLYLPLVKGFPR